MSSPRPSGWLRRNGGVLALAVSFLALLASLTGVSDAARTALANVVSKPKPKAVLRLDSKGKFPARAIPTVSRARRADALGSLSAADVKVSCAKDQLDLGTWCLSKSLYEVPEADRGRVDWFYAAQACTDDGGFLPSVDQLLAAAPKLKLASYLTDATTGAVIDTDAADGLADLREMTSTLVTTESGSTAAGFLGTSTRSRGNPVTGEPNPVAFPAIPVPSTLQYVTVVDNAGRGGVAGSKPVTQGELFRCGFFERQGTSSTSSSGDTGDTGDAGDDTVAELSAKARR